MGLSIKRAETERKARAVAEHMGVSVTEAIDIALGEKLDELGAKGRQAKHDRDREALFARIRARGPGDGRSLKEIEVEMYGDGGESI